MLALRRLQQCARSLLPMEAMLCAAAKEQVAGVTSGPAGAVYNVGKASLGLA